MVINSKTNILNAALFSVLLATLNFEAMASKEETSEMKSKPKTFVDQFSDPNWVKNSGKILFETILSMPGYTLTTGTNTYTFKLPITNCINNFNIEDMLDLTKKTLKETVTVEYDANTTGNLGDAGLFAYKFRQDIKAFTFILSVTERKLEERKLSLIVKDEPVTHNDEGDTTKIGKRRSKSMCKIPTLKEEDVKSKTENPLTSPKRRPPPELPVNKEEVNELKEEVKEARKKTPPPPPPQDLKPRKGSKTSKEEMEKDEGDTNIPTPLKKGDWSNETWLNDPEAQKLLLKILTQQGKMVMKGKETKVYSLTQEDTQYELYSPFNAFNHDDWIDNNNLKKGVTLEPNGSMNDNYIELKTNTFSKFSFLFKNSLDVKAPKCSLILEVNTKPTKIETLKNELDSTKEKGIKKPPLPPVRKNSGKKTTDIDKQ